jgi:O-phospho-L-seryl-tRNASec:L-selenocysteinyl-tRNA synthase
MALPLTPPSPPTINALCLSRAIMQYGAHSILCVISTTSCFAPRAADRVVEIAQICQEFGIAHIINNAYGLQASKLTHLVEQACRLGRVDCFVQSTDKNFMVPVGGSIVASCHKQYIKLLSQMYPGRASASPMLDLCITLLQMGVAGYRQLLDDRKVC